MINVEVRDSGVQKLLRRLAASVRDLKPAMAEIGDNLSNNIRMGFKSSRDPWGGRWKSLSQSGIMGRLGHRKNSFGKRGKISAAGRGYLTGGVQPLLDTGALRSSITYQATGNSVVVGTNLKYARTHQFGAKQGQYGRTRRNSPIPWGNIPARPFMPISSAGRADLPVGWRDEIADVLIRRLMASVHA